MPPAVVSRFSTLSFGVLGTLCTLALWLWLSWIAPRIVSDLKGYDWRLLALGLSIQVVHLLGATLAATVVALCTYNETSASFQELSEPAQAGETRAPSATEECEWTPLTMIRLGTSVFFGAASCLAANAVASGLCRDLGIRRDCSTQFEWITVQFVDVLIYCLCGLVITFSWKPHFDNEQARRSVSSRPAKPSLNLPKRI